MFIHVNQPASHPTRRQTANYLATENGGAFKCLTRNSIQTDRQTTIDAQRGTTQIAQNRDLSLQFHI